MMTERDVTFDKCMIYLYVLPVHVLHTRLRGAKQPVEMAMLLSLTLCQKP